MTSAKTARKRSRRFQLVKAAQPFDPYENHRSDSGGTIFGNNACTRKLLPIYIPGNWLAVSPYFRSALDLFSQTSHFPCGNAVPFGFCCGGFSSTAGYVPGNEARIPKDPSDFATSRPIISSKRDCVFIRCRSRLVLRLCPEAKPFGFSMGCDSCDSRLSPLSNDASPLRLPIPLLVTTPVSTATRVWLYARVQNKSSRKYFKS